MATELGIRVSTPELLATNRSAAGDGSYWLPPHVVACARIEGTVLLDLKRNRYYGLSSRKSVELSAIVHNWPTLAGYGLCTEPSVLYQAVERDAAALVKAGLLSEKMPPICGEALKPEVPRASIDENTSTPTRTKVSHVLVFIESYLWAEYNARCRSFDQIIRAVQAMRTQGHPHKAHTGDGVVRDLSIFRTLRSFTFTARGRCLVHSLALLKFMSHYKVFPTWVIGVKLRPWVAHSWVQLHEVVLDSTPEKVCEFTPILVV